jgi:hypothetical protein
MSKARNHRELREALDNGNLDRIRQARNETPNSVVSSATITEPIETSSDDDVIAVVGDVNTTVIDGYGALKARCKDVRRTQYKWGFRWVFSFVIVEPGKYEGTTIPMYVRLIENDSKKHLAESRKLYKIACIAAGYRLPRGVKITKSFWVGQTFLCRLHQVDEGAVRHTIVETIIRKVEE